MSHDEAVGFHKCLGYKADWIHIEQDVLQQYILKKPLKHIAQKFVQKWRELWQSRQNQEIFQHLKQ